MYMFVYEFSKMGAFAASSLSSIYFLHPFYAHIPRSGSSPYNTLYDWTLCVTLRVQSYKCLMQHTNSSICIFTVKKS